MRYLILSDIHANMEAFESVLEAAKGLAYDRVLVLGDLVGYGADPNAVVDKVRAMAPHCVIRGNHDKVASGVESAEGFNAVARNAIRWTYDSLTADNRQWLAALPQGPIDVDDLIEICHGTPFDEDHYTFDGHDASFALQSAQRPLCLYGHTHLPALFKIVEGVFEGTSLDPDRDVVIPLQRGARYLVNVGSIGQPRDGEPRAGYGILDDEARELRTFRVRYPVEDAQRKIIAAGLPASLANRLALGR